MLGGYVMVEIDVGELSSEGRANISLSTEVEQSLIQIDKPLS